MVNTFKVDGQGNIFSKPEAIVYYNTKIGGVDQWINSCVAFKCWEKLTSGTRIYFCLIMLLLLSSHKLYKSRSGKIGFLQFIHDVVCKMVAHAANLSPRLPKYNLLHLTGRHSLFRFLTGDKQLRRHILTRNVEFAMLQASELLQVIPS